MKKLILLLFAIVSFNSLSQNIEASWLNTEQPEMNKAIEISKKTNKPLMLFFTGSDWCGWCKRLVREVYKTPEFEKWAKKNVVLVEIDFPRKKMSQKLTQQNNSLKNVFNPRGYPTVYFANAVKGSNGDVQFQTLGQIGYVSGGASKWIAAANEQLKR
tara:strand:- start:968 stop:1441 length:474 start_codon:yes stop_codon:yes gene_type:complete